MPLCPHCHTVVSQDARFCSECGRPLSIGQATKGTSKKKLAGVIAACIIAIIVIVVIVVIATRPPTPIEPEPEIPAHYTTYTDELGRFSISYPPEWESALELLQEIAPSEMEGINFLYMAGLPSLGGYRPNITIATAPCPSIICAHDAIVNAEIEAMKATDPSYQEISRVKTTINGRTATILVSQSVLPGEPTLQYVQMFLIAGRTVWLVTCTTLENEYSNWEDDFDAIVRSLRILK